jgi:hypothetical protein
MSRSRNTDVGSQQQASSHDQGQQEEFVPCGIGEGEGDIDPHNPRSPHYVPIPHTMRNRGQSQQECSSSDGQHQVEG